ncbi:MAG: gliding motility protein GldC [Flavobacteriales bacterium]|nr:gliding motility protein GldC [Flavobacteriales bacterium]NNK79919.1 gliding motility protein GldC [Flavobacteriales bacterium]
MKKQIRINVTLDENHLPEKLDWEADDSDGPKEASAALISFWDKKEEQAMRIDLWDKDFTTDEMKTFFVQTLLTMNDTLERATGDKETCEGIRKFGVELGKRFGVIKD